MTKVEFANAPNGTMVRFAVNSCVYRIRQRISRTLVMERVTPRASASLVEIVKESQRGEWEIEEKARRKADREFAKAFTPNKHGEYA